MAAQESADLRIPDIFLPSDYHVDSDLERRPDPVEEIVLTDEEVARMFPS